MRKVILFDLDGTLTDPKEGITKCVQYALKHFGIIENDLDKLEVFIGPPLKEQFMQYCNFDDKRGIECVEKYRERFNDIGIFENKIYEGIEKLLKRLRDKGIIMAVASSKPTVYVDRILKHFGITGYFDVVMGSELDGRRTNKADVVREALYNLNIEDNDTVVMIGDRCHDIIGAKENGICSIGVSYGYGSRNELEQAGADYIVESIIGLGKILGIEM